MPKHWQKMKKKSLVQLAQNLKPWFSGTEYVTSCSSSETRSNRRFPRFHKTARWRSSHPTMSWLKSPVLNAVLHRWLAAARRYRIRTGVRRAYGRSRHQEQRRVPDVLRTSVHLYFENSFITCCPTFLPLSYCLIFLVIF